MTNFILLDWIKIECNDIEITKDELNFIFKTLNPIVGISPTQTSFILVLTQKDQTIKGILRANSYEQKILCLTEAENIYRLCLALRKDYDKQIDFWKKSRFLISAV